MKKAVVAMSGGVDSSVAACLMKEQGYECMGVTMKLFHNEDVGVPREHSCCSLDDVEDARSVARKLRIPYYVFNFSDRFTECVIEKFIQAYEHGCTPNPCIDCNKFLKFDKLFQRAKELGYDYVVTGHYARVEYDAISRRYLLKKGLDDNKDQSYVLYTMTQEQLAHTIFPLGNLNKHDVRKIAEIHGFINANKLESQDICFVQNGRYVNFIEQYTGKHYPSGDFVDAFGKVLGKHKGIINYTIGQRKGLGVAFEEPLYVCGIDAERNTVRLGRSEELLKNKLIAKDINLISVPDLFEPKRLKAKIRYHQQEQWVTVLQINSNTLSINFDEPQRAITPGQAVVLYDGDVVVGGGRIV